MKAALVKFPVHVKASLNFLPFGDAFDLQCTRSH